MAQHNFFYRNGLSIALFLLMIFSMAGQFYTGWKTENQELADEGAALLSAVEYLQSGHFIQALFENWESEFLQMMLYILLTVHLRQKGSAESKSLTEKEEVDREPQPHANAPAAVKKGGFILKIYQHSLSLAFGILFLLSFMLHFYGSMKDFNAEQALRNKPPASTGTYIPNPGSGLSLFRTGKANFWPLPHWYCCPYG